ncbi:hypothetical protein MMC34_005171 [Xylographa carneopallida]|nr:hypothetical protein [Xylographa carneopallida]
MAGATETIISLYSLTPDSKTSLTSSIDGNSLRTTSTAAVTPTNIPSTSVSSLESQSTLTFPQPTSTSTVFSTDTPNGTISGADPQGPSTHTDRTTPAIMAGAVIGGCLLGGLAIAFGWFLWKRALLKQKRVKPTIRNKRFDTRRLSAIWSSADAQMQSRSTQTIPWDEGGDSFSDPENPFRDSLAPSTITESQLGDDTASDSGYKETAEVRSERLDRLFRRNHSPTLSDRHGFSGHSSSPVRDNYRMDWLSGSPRSATMMPLPPILKRTSIPAPLFSGSDLLGSPPSAQIKPSAQDFSRSRPLSSPRRSSLKSPLKSSRNQSGAVSSQGMQENFTSPMMSGTKKEVRFGGEQIKEFGWTPYASTVNSAMDEFDDQIVTV